MKDRSIWPLAGLVMILVLSGCNVAKTFSNAGIDQQHEPSSTVIFPSESSTPSASATPEMTSTPPAASSALLVGTATPRSTTVFLGASIPSGWIEYTSKKYQVSLYYPSDWTVEETPAGVELSSPQGEMIRLAKVVTGSLTPEEYLNQTQPPNTRCTSSINQQNLFVMTCFDTISRSYTANVVLKTGQSATELISLSLSQESEIQIFETIISSLRPAAS